GGEHPSSRTGRAKPRACRRRELASAAGGVGPADPPRLHDPAEEPPAELRAVSEPRRCGARRLPALSRQQPAGKLRPARHADPVDAAREEKSLCEKALSHFSIGPRPQALGSPPSRGRPRDRVVVDASRAGLIGGRYDGGRKSSSRPFW